MFDASYISKNILLPMLCIKSRSQWPTVQESMHHRFSHEGGWCSIKGHTPQFWDDFWCQVIGTTIKEECLWRKCKPEQLLGPHTRSVLLLWARRGKRQPEGSLVAWQAVKNTVALRNTLAKHKPPLQKLQVQPGIC